MVRDAKSDYPEIFPLSYQVKLFLDRFVSIDPMAINFKAFLSLITIPLFTFFTVLCEDT